MNNTVVAGLLTLIASLSIIALNLNKISLEGVNSAAVVIPDSDITSPTHPVFIDKTYETGLIFKHQQRDEEIHDLLDSLGAGGCVIDYDNDGWMDLFLISGAGQTRFYGERQWWKDNQPNKLFKNLNGKRFEDVTDAVGIPSSPPGYGCLAADLDNDGDSDLYLANYGANQLLENNGNGKFSDISIHSKSSGDKASWSTTAAVSDYDRDGWLDLYVTNFIDYTKGKSTFERFAGYQQSMKPFDAALFDSQKNDLFHNQGDLIFHNVSDLMAVDNPSGRSLSAVFIDLNGDLYADVYVANAEGSTDKLLLGSSLGIFVDSTDKSLLNNTSLSSSVISIDLDQDDDLDLAISGSTGVPPKLLINQSARSDSNKVRFVDHAQIALNNLENRLFKESWSITATDVNNDHWPDLLLSNGSLYPDIDYRKQRTTGQGNDLFINNRDGSFREISSYKDHIRSQPRSSRSTLVFDYDNDGDPDLFTINNNAQGTLLQNSSAAGSWIGLKLRTENNMEAVGARVIVVTNSGENIYNTYRANTGTQSSHDPRLLIGLGTEDSLKHINIIWPDGSNTRYDHPPRNQYLQIHQDQPSWTNSVVLSTPESTDDLTELTDQEFDLYTDIILSSKKPEHIKTLVNQIIARNNDTNKIRLLENLNKTDYYYKVLIKHLLAHPSQSNRRHAIEALANSKDDDYFSLILDGLNDGSVEIEDFTIKKLQFIFDQEEDFYTTKQSAVKLLIKLLSHHSKSIRLAVIDALGRSESYRAVVPLIKQLGDNSNDIIIAAIQALGHIRERSAEPEIKRIMALHPDNEPILFHSISTLKRISNASLESLLRPLLEQDQMSSLSKLDLVRLLTTGDSPFGQNDVINVVENSALNIQMKWLLQFAAGSPRAGNKLLQEIDSLSPETIYSLCHRALLKAPPQSDIFIKSFCGRLTTETRRTLFTSVVEKSHPLPFSLVNIFIDSTQNDQLASNLSRLKSSTISDQLLITLASDPGLSTNHRLEALTILGSRQSKLSTYPDTILNDPSSNIRKQAFIAWYKRIGNHQAWSHLPKVVEQALSDTDTAVANEVPTIMASRREPWARLLCREWLSDINHSIESRSLLLNLLSADNREFSQVKSIADDPDDPLSQHALLALANYNNQSVAPLLESVYKNNQHPRVRRLMAARSLSTIDPAAAVKAALLVTETATTQ